MFRVDVDKGQVWKWPLDQLRHRGAEIQQHTPSVVPTNCSSDDNDFCPLEQDAPPPERDAALGMDPPRDHPPDGPPSPGRDRPYPRRERHSTKHYGRHINW